jgi:hypothetical protein
MLEQYLETGYACLLPIFFNSPNAIILSHNFILNNRWIWYSVVIYKHSWPINIQHKLNASYVFLVTAWKLRANAHAVSRRLFTAESLVRYQGNQYGICSRESVTAIYLVMWGGKVSIENFPVLKKFQKIFRNMFPENFLFLKIIT